MGRNRRAAIAVLLSALGALVGVAGAGHAYLREWRRAAAWFALAVGAALVLLATFTNPATVDPASVPDEVTLPLLAVFALCTIDAYLVATRSARAVDAGRACPNCGKELDGDLTFCPWCTERVVPPEEEADATSR